MAELYDYLLVAYKFLVGLVASNPKRLIFIAVMAVAFYLVWIAAALYLSFQHKFSKNCAKLSNFIKGSSLDSTNLQVVDLKIEKISNGFYHGWKKFKNTPNAKPSDFISRREALDVEVSGGVLNQGKTFMRAFITITTLFLFLFNLAYLGADKTLTTGLIAETLVFPLVYFAVMKLFYFMYTSIKQQLYKQDIECFYDLIDLLDETFGSKQAAPTFVAGASYIHQSANVIPSDDEVVALENNENSLEEQAEQTEEGSEEQLEQAEEVDENPLKSLDKYDIFKKKNIDVDKIINEVPQNAGTSLPYINVDSDYVIKDNENRETAKIVTDEDSPSSILGGMMQDRASLKKNNENFLDVEKQVAEIDQEKIAEVTASEKKEEPAPADSDPFSAFDKFEVAENAVVEETAEPTPSEQTTVESVVEEKKEEPTPVVEPEPVPAPIPEPTPVVEPEPVGDGEVSEQEKESIAIAVSGFKTNRSKLASGGVVIERNEPIARRERPVVYEEPTPEPEIVEPEPAPVQDMFPRHDEIQQLNINENTDSILNSIKTSAGGYDAYGAYGDPYANQGYGQGYGYNPQQTFAPNGYAPNPYAAPQINNFGGYQNQGYAANPYAGDVNQTSYGQEYDSYDEADEDVYEEEIDEVEEVAKPAKKKRTKEEEPRPRNLRKKVETKVEETQSPAKTRGRPKKQEVSETMTIKSDKEFDEVLSRAEKLMRKSEEGLSASQSKRIEKELKMLMDAMNRYKENK